MDKIYSRNRRIYLPKFNNYNSQQNNNKRKMLKIITVITMAIITAEFVLHAITPILNKQCVYMAKRIATLVSNEQTSIVMSKYKYDDLCIITKDEKRKYSNDKCKCYCYK